jgi:uncharacterized membrane protein YgcG
MKIKDLMIKISCLYFFLLVNQTIFGQQYTVNTVPNPKTTNNTWVSDPDNLIFSDVEKLLNDKISIIEQKSSCEIALVVLKSIGKDNPADFSVNLFNYWKVGKAGKNNGLLILIVMDQRRVEFKTGYGLEATLTDKECVDIQQNYMVPNFKSGDYARGLSAGIDAVAIELLGKENWQRTPMPDELIMLQMIASRTGKKRSNTQRVFDADTLLSDSIHSISEQIAKTFKDSFKLGTYFYVYKSLNGISPTKMSGYLDSIHAYSKNNKNLMIWVFDGKTKSFDLFSKFEDQNNVYNNRALLDYFREQLQQYNQEGSVYIFQLAITEMLQTVLSDSIKQLKIKTQLENEAERQKLKETTPENYEPVKKGNSFWWIVFVFYLWATGIFTLVTLLFILSVQFVEDPYRKYKLLVFLSFDIWMFLFPIPFIGIGLWIDKLKQGYRDAPRKDPKTGKELFKLSEKEEDKFLKSGQLTEERINSIHYDVWASEDKKEILVLSYPIYFTKYSRCPKCSTKAYYLVFNRTITSATTYSSGVGEKKYECKHCKHTHQYTYVIPKIEKSSSSSSSSRSYGGSGGGGSFGGGSSGGGGGGSSW